MLQTMIVASVVVSGEVYVCQGRDEESLVFHPLSRFVHHNDNIKTAA